MTRRRYFVLGLIVAVVIVLAAVAAGTAEVLEKGRLLDYSEGTIYKLEVLGGVTVYVEPDIKPSPDLLNGGLLLIVAGMSALAALLCRGENAWFAAVTGVASAALAVDELTGVHESIGHNLRWLAEMPGVERPDDAIIALYGLVALLYAWRFRRILLGSRAALIAGALSFGTFVLAAGMDLVGAGLEEPLEVVATLAALAAVALLYRDLLRPDISPSGA